MEHDEEPVRGLPERLPMGERILWQGSPVWRTLARTVFHTRIVAIYFAVLVAGAVAIGADTPGIAATVIAAILGLGLLHLLAWAVARTSVYTLTNRRIVLRTGVALQTCINVPLNIVASADIALHADGTGDLPLKLRGYGKLGYAHLWPHARPWALKEPEPMLRAVPDAARVGALIAEALLAANPAGRRQAIVVPGSDDAAVPAGLAA